ncbi:MAG: hypothetical protein ABI295_02825 [Xanthomarina sp.]
MFKFSKVFFLGLLMSFSLLSCSSDDDADANGNGGGQTNSDGSYLNYKVSGAINHEINGKARVGIGRLAPHDLYSFLFESNDTLHKHSISIAGNSRYNEGGTGTFGSGIPVEVHENGDHIIKKGTYSITGKRVISFVADPSFYVTYQTGGDYDYKLYGYHTSTTSGNITITNSGPDFCEGTFMFETSEYPSPSGDAPSDPIISVVGSFKVVGIEF